MMLPRDGNNSARLSALTRRAAERASFDILARTFGAGLARNKYLQGLPATLRWGCEITAKLRMIDICATRGLGEIRAGLTTRS